MKLFWSVLREAFLEFIVCFWVDVQNLFRRFRKKKITTFDEKDLYNPKKINNGAGKNIKVRISGSCDLADGVDKKL
jgi:hypothetical protein